MQGIEERHKLYEVNVTIKKILPYIDLTDDEIEEIENVKELGEAMA
ncbi:MAG: hypothetical protein K2I10_04530 [Lachnospiraceae bacterium]|nr:hypothetical protein [Lachnospiraceae bacterium]